MKRTNLWRCFSEVDGEDVQVGDLDCQTGALVHQKHIHLVYRVVWLLQYYTRDASSAGSKTVF